MGIDTGGAIWAWKYNDSNLQTMDKIKEMSDKEDILEYLLDKDEYIRLAAEIRLKELEEIEEEIYNSYREFYY